MEKIDFVILWVDGSDKKWLEKKNKYLPKDKQFDIDDSIRRYRDMNLLKYWFRGVEKYAPWVNKIYFVTDHQKPDWLNENNPKLVLVNHDDYIDSKYLPLFNSTAIEMYLSKIKGLSEQFVYFNDDFFIINNVKETDFFKNGLPVANMALGPVKISKEFYHRTLINNLEIINNNFNFKECLNKNKSKYFSLKEGKNLLYTLASSRFDSFVGFLNGHSANSYIKRDWDECLNNCGDYLENTMNSRFRDNKNNINQFVFQYWQFAKGDFYQRSYKFCKYFSIDNNNINNWIINKKSKLICINDTVDDNFDLYTSNIKKSFDKILGEKSTFEK